MKSAIIILLLASVARLGAEDPITLDKTIPLPGVEGRIDHFSLDPDHDRLFLAALGCNKVEVISLADAVDGAVDKSIG